MGRGKTRPARRAEAHHRAAERNKRFLSFCDNLPAILLELFRGSADPTTRALFIAALQDQVEEGNHDDLGSSPFTTFLNRCHALLHQLPKPLAAALEERKQEVAARRREHSKLAAKLGLRRASNEIRTAKLLSESAVYEVERLPPNQSYPPRGAFVCESRASLRGWSQWVQNNNLHPADSRQVSASSVHTPNPPLSSL